MRVGGRWAAARLFSAKKLTRKTRMERPKTAKFRPEVARRLSMGIPPKNWTRMNTDDADEKLCGVFVCRVFGLRRDKRPRNPAGL